MPPAVLMAFETHGTQPIGCQSIRLWLRDTCSVPRSENGQLFPVTPLYLTVRLYLGIAELTLLCTVLCPSYRGTFESHMQRKLEAEEQLKEYVSVNAL